MQKTISLTQHISEKQVLYSDVKREFLTIMMQIALGGKLIADDLRKIGLTDNLGSTGALNIHGEQVQKLDEIANNTFVNVCENIDIVRMVISEEMEEPYSIARGEKTGKYAVFFDPLDGSSNIDVNASLGTIFSIHRVSQDKENNGRNLLKRGDEQIGSGYLLYGPNTILVYTCGNGVHLFTLDPSNGEFLLSLANITIPKRGNIYSINQGNIRKWNNEMKSFIRYLQESDFTDHQPYSLRYSGCLVADVHRVLLKGGLYLYPNEVEKPEGKLRLMYEAAPLSFIVEQSGGLGSSGIERINSIQPKDLHQRVPLVIGSREDVEITEKYLTPGAI